MNDKEIMSKITFNEDQTGIWLSFFCFILLFSFYFIIIQIVRSAIN